MLPVYPQPGRQETRQWRQGERWTLHGNVSHLAIRRHIYRDATSLDVNRVIGLHVTAFLAGTKAAGTYRSSNNGATWLPSNTGIETKSVVCMASNAAFTFCGAEFTSQAGLEDHIQANPGHQPARIEGQFP